MSLPIRVLYKTIHGRKDGKTLRGRYLWLKSAHGGKLGGINAQTCQRVLSQRIIFYTTAISLP